MILCNGMRNDQTIMIHEGMRLTSVAFGCSPPGAGIPGIVWLGLFLTFTNRADSRNTISISISVHVAALCHFLAILHVDAPNARRIFHHILFFRRCDRGGGANCCSHCSLGGELAPNCWGSGTRVSCPFLWKTTQHSKKTRQSVSRNPYFHTP